MAEAAGRIRGERRVLKKFREAGAISTETACLKRAGVWEKYAARDLPRYGRLKRTDDNRYYVV
jgi:hypothetical protein